QAWALRRGAFLRSFDGTMYFLLSPILGDYSEPLKISGYNAAQLPVTGQRIQSLHSFIKKRFPSFHQATFQSSSKK
ncbi:hypothetical protein, partial [Acidithiobacillus sulfurivorans]|uniref:hypothetical protein n=1 Tax=Acidithiobacillus sulfurivorans TaxID=1958756 RepID=UPI001C07338D